MFWNWCSEVSNLVAAKVNTPEGSLACGTDLVVSYCNHIYVMWQIHKSPQEAADAVYRLYIASRSSGYGTGHKEEIH